MKSIKKYMHLIIAFLFLSSNIYALSKDEEAFFMAIEKGDIKTVQTLISKGIDVNVLDNKGFSSLHRAVFINNKEIVQELLGVKNIKTEATLPKGTYLYMSNGIPWDAYGQTPLHIASFKGYTEIVNALLDNNADILAKDEANYATALHIAVAQKNTKTIITLLNSESAKKSKINLLEVKDKTGNTPLIYSMIYNRNSIMALLMDYNPNIEATDNVNRTALHYAIDNDNYEAVEMLLKAGASFTSKDIYGATQYDLVKDINIRGLIKFYMRAKARDGLLAVQK